MNETIYLNWAATSVKKPQGTIEGVCSYLKKNINESSGRGSDVFAQNRLIFNARLTLAEFFGVEKPEEVIFTSGATQGMNMILNGLLNKGDHIITSSVEHNAVTRPLHLLEKQGVEVTYVGCDEEGITAVEEFTRAIKPNTKAVVLTHASNVTGTIQPIETIFKIAKEHHLVTILDASQTAGVLPLNVQEMQIDILVFTGHKSLLGLSGTGGFCIKDAVTPMVEPWLVGGTGNNSELDDQPDFLPDKYEPGTPNSLGILSLDLSVKEINRRGLSNIFKHEQELTSFFIEGLKTLPVRILGPKNQQLRAPVVSIVTPDYDAGDLAADLQEDYHIVTRSGLHCAPHAHRMLHTYPTGAIRFSFGYETTKEELIYTLNALKELLEV